MLSTSTNTCLVANSQYSLTCLERPETLYTNGICSYSALSTDPQCLACYKPGAYHANTDGLIQLPMFHHITYLATLLCTLESSSHPNSKLLSKAPMHTNGICSYSALSTDAQCLACYEPGANTDGLIQVPMFHHNTYLATLLCTLESSPI